MRVHPRSSLSVQLIQEARFGPGRFEPWGPPLDREHLLPHSLQRGSDRLCLTAAVQPKPQACPADLHVRATSRDRPIAVSVDHAAPRQEVVVRERIVGVTLPNHAVGTLLDVMA